MFLFYTLQSPLLLLFLDCVWQLLQQFPTEFEFTETYLTTLWDASHISIFDTFLFDCEQDRHYAINVSVFNFIFFKIYFELIYYEFNVQNEPSPLILRSVWDWEEQFLDRDLVQFHNPLYNASKVKDNFLKVSTEMSCLNIWTQCYYRFLPTLEISNGGKPLVSKFIIIYLYF